MIESVVLRNDRVCRAAIGKVLKVLIGDESSEYKKDVKKMLEQWANHEDIKLRWASSRAYADVGLYFPDDAFKQWRNIVNSEKNQITVAVTDNLYLSLANPLHMSIVDAIISLLLTAIETERTENQKYFRPVFETALKELKNWVDEDKKRKTYFALPLFVMLTQIEYSATSIRPLPPAMLVALKDLDSKSKYLEYLTDLLCRALLSTITFKQALSALHNWFKQVEGTSYQDQLFTLIQNIIIFLVEPRRDIVIKQLKFHLNRWAQIDQLDSAREALRYLN